MASSLSPSDTHISETTHESSSSSSSSHGETTPSFSFPTLDSSTYAAVAVTEILNTIIDKGGDILYDHYLQAKETDFVVARTVQSLKLLVDWQLPRLEGAEYRPEESALQGYLASVTGTLPSSSSSSPANPNVDDGSPTGSSSSSSGPMDDPNLLGSWMCEPEPAPVPLDTWARSSIPTRLPFMKRTEMESRRLRSQQSMRSNEDQHTDPLGGLPRSNTTGSIDTGGTRSAISSVNNKGTIQQMHLAPIEEGVDEDNQHLTQQAAILTAAAAERARIIAELDRKKRKEEESQRKNEQEAKEKEARDRAFRKKLRGKHYTIDEHGGILLVTKPNPDRLPPTVLPVKSSEFSSHDQLTVTVSSPGSPSRSSPSRSSLPSFKTVKTGDTMSAGDRTTRMEIARRDPKFFRDTISGQPSLIDNVPEGTLVAGVSIREEGRMLAGPVPSTDDRRITRQDLAVKQYSLTGSTSQLTMTGSLILNGNNNNGAMGDNNSTMYSSYTDNMNFSPYQGQHPQSSPSQHSLEEFSLTSIPDVIEIPSTDNRYGQTSPQPRPYPDRSVREAIYQQQMEEQERQLLLQQQQQQQQQQQKQPTQYIPPENSNSPPRSYPLAPTSKQREAALGTLSRNPRDRVPGYAATMPSSHLPPPPFPAISHFDPRPDAPQGTAALLGAMYASLADTRKIPEVLRAAALAVSASPGPNNNNSLPSTNPYSTYSTMNNSSPLPGGGYAVRPNSASQQRSPDADVGYSSRAGARLLSSNTNGGTSGNGEWGLSVQRKQEKGTVSLKRTTVK